MADLVWEDPPQTTTKQRAHERNQEILQELQANPGRWARVATEVSIGTANTWVRWNCEVRRRVNRETGKFTIWARWVEIT